MLIVFGAIWKEMKDYGKKLGLKKTKKDTLCPVYEDEAGKIRLVITGVGGVAAAFAVGWYLGAYGHQKEDVYLNIGSCGGEEGAEGVYRIHGIEDLGDHKTYYPDLRGLYQVPTAKVYTSPEAVDGKMIRRIKEKNPGEVCLFDMEAAGLYQALRKVTGPDRMIFLKAVSDHGMGEEASGSRQIEEAPAQESPQITTAGQQEASESRQIEEAPAQENPQITTAGQQVSMKMQENSDQLVLYTKRIIEHYFRKEVRENSSGEEDLQWKLRQKWEEELSADLCASKTMELQLSQLCRYAYAAGMETELRDIVSDLRSSGELPANNRCGGKRILETLKKSLVPIC